MINFKLFLNKISKLRDSFLSNNLSREIGTKRNKFRIPVLVLDLKTKQSYEYASIAEAARSFDTHSKTIWRVIYNNKLYLNRYQIIEINKDKELEIWYNMYKYFNNIVIVIKSNKAFIYHTLLYLILGFLICTFIFFILVFYKDIHDHYIFALREGRVNYNKCILEHKLTLNHVINNSNTVFITNKFNFIDIKEWRYDFIFNNKWTSINKTSELGIYQSIINEINLDFNDKGTGTFTGLNSSYSSPIIERVNINNLFSNAISSASAVNDTTNSLGIQGINYGSNRNFVIVDNVLMNTRLKTTELLNYQSNILYCLINGLSPSIY